MRKSKASSPRCSTSQRATIAPWKPISTRSVVSNGPGRINQAFSVRSSTWPKSQLRADWAGFMIVDAAQRGRGVGRSIYSTVESWAAARGAIEIRLAVLEANEAAERFWRSLGFIEYRRVGPDTFKMRSHRRIELSRRLSGATVEGSNK
ncbi:GNAT family N-acetyltransferase [Sphingobium lactosutens]|uniref:GNAT family N-acetyltransferase n=1 Tax=Sphingobium lactosutens TaxID=522773 RepID=UPI002E8248F3|nr:GNAT family N-acetyltransferase [Sphingobium lactosutens]